MTFDVPACLSTEAVDVMTFDVPTASGHSLAAISVVQMCLWASSLALPFVLKLTMGGHK